MKKRDDIDIRTTWIVSDTHWGHKNIAGYSARPDDHEAQMMEEWARAVPDDATVLHLGDLSYSNNRFFQAIIAKHLTGKRKLLIAGNHDKGRYSFYRDCGFKVVSPFYIDTHGHRVSFSHYPDAEIAALPDSERVLRVHGHIHNSGYTRAAYVPFLRNHVNVSVEQTHYRPVNLELLLDAVLFGIYPGDGMKGSVQGDEPLVKNNHVREQIERVRASE